YCSLQNRKFQYSLLTVPISARLRICNPGVLRYICRTEARLSRKSLLRYRLMSAASYRYKQNRFQQLRGFCCADSSGSSSKAAQRMSLSQPAVSQQIQGLENELAVTLF